MKLTPVAHSVYFMRLPKPALEKLLHQKIMPCRKRLIKPLIKSGISLLAAVMILSPAIARAQTTNFWTTPTGGSWNTKGNWSVNVPSSTTLAVFTNTTGAQTITLSGTGNAGGLVFSNARSTLLYSSATATRTLNLYGSGITVASGAGSVTLGNTSSNLVIALNAAQGWTNNSTNTLSIIANSTNSFGLTLDGAGTTIISGVIGVASLTKQGSGTSILTASNTYSGTTTIAGGVLQVGNGTSGESLGSGGVVLSNNATLGFYESDTLTIGNTISGNGNLTVTGTYGSTNWVNGTGWTILTAPNTFSGTITVANGVLQATSDGQLGNSTNGITLNGGELFNNGAMLTLNAGRTITLTTNGGNLDGGWGQYPAANNGITVLGSITGNGGTNGLSVSWDWGGVVLAGSNNYTGPTTIGSTNSPYWYDSGSAYTTYLVLSNANALPTGSQLIFSATPTNVNASDAYTAELNLNGYSASVGGISGGTNALIVNSQAATTLTLAPSNASSWSGEILQTNGVMSVVMQGSGTQSFLSSNNYSGGTTINAGTLALSNNNAMGTGTVTFASNATIASLASLTVTNAFSIASNATATIDMATNNTLTASGVISGAGSLTKIDSGTLTLSGTNTYSGTTTISTNGGSLSLGTTGKLASTNIIVNSGGTLLLGGNNQTTTNTTLTLAGGTLSAGGGSTTRSQTNSFSALTLTGNSTIDYSSLSGNSVMNFNTITSTGLDSYTLTVLNWSGTMLNGVVIGSGTTTQLNDLVGSLTQSELAHISFYSGSTTNSGFLGTGAFNGHQIVPVPEPAVVVTCGLLVAVLAGSCYRQHCKKRH